MQDGEEDDDHNIADWAHLYEAGAFEARRDLKETKQREDLRPEKRVNGQHYLRPASYTLSKEEKENMLIA